MSKIMFQINRGWLAVLVACLLPLAAFGQAGNAGTVTGQVSNSATKAYLEGATVELVGTGRSTTTDRTGRFVFEGVPAGSVTLSVAFAGLDSQQIPVAVAAGQRVVRDVELTTEVYKLEKFTVAGEREGTAKAQTLQRIAPNVKAIVSSDTFGNVADGNIGDMLQHVVGLTADYNGPDVRQVSIRGVGSALNSVTMDGQQIASAQSAGTGRQFEFEQASLGNIETIEVTKAPTPDMDGASIGGSVNLVSKSAFDRAGRTITYGAGFTTQPGYMGPTQRWKQPIDGYGPSFNFSYQDVIGEKRNIGITLTALMHSQPAGGAIIAESYERKDAPGPVYNYATTRTMVNGATRSRIATTLKVDYKWSDETTIAVNTSWNFFHENNDTRSQAFSNVGVATAAVPNTLATVDAAGNRTGGGYVNPNYTSTYTRLYANPLATNVITMTSNDKSGRTYLFSPSVKHRFADGLSIDYSGTWSNSATYYDISHNNEKFGSRPKGTISYRMNNIGLAIDRSKDRIWPNIIQLEGADMTKLNNYTWTPGAARAPLTDTLLLSQTDLRGFDTVLGGKFDVKKNFAVALPTYIKTGFTIQDQKRKLWQDPRRYNYTGPDGVLNTADDNADIAQFLENPHPSTTDEDKYFKNNGGVPPWVNPYGVARHQKLYPELWKEDVAFTSGKLTTLQMIDEKIAAAYVMGNVKWNSLSLLTGIRFENTKDTGEGALTVLTPAEVARRAAWVGPVTDAEQRRRNLEQYGRRFTQSGKYSFWLPGVHLKYEPIPNFLARLSWSTGVGRPAFGSIIPNTVVNDTAQTVTLSNPALKPQYGRSWDLSTEYYFKPQGMVSFGAFRKDIRDYIATNNSTFVQEGQNNGFDGQYVGYRISTSINDGNARIEGLEFNYQQQLVFLPGWMKGLSAYANWTKLRTSGNNSSFTTGPSSSAGGTIAGFLDTTGNLGFGYVGHGFDLRLQAIYRGKYLRANSTQFALVQWQEPKTTWNWKSRYNFTKTFGVFFDVENIFSVPLDNIWAGYSDRNISYRTFHAKIVGGLQGRF